MVDQLTPPVIAETGRVCVNILDVLLPYLKDVLVPLAWPCTAFGALLIFKSELRGVLKRVIKAGPSGFEMSPQFGDQPPKAPDPFSDDAFRKIEEDDPGLKVWIDDLEGYLKKNPQHSNIESIKRIAAAQSRRAHCIYIYSRIYGSQLQALERMVEGPQLLKHLTDLYIQHANAAEKFAYPNVEAWVQFLQITNLVNIEDGKLYLTEFGNSFYDLLVRSGVSMKSRVW